MYLLNNHRERLGPSHLNPVTAGLKPVWDRLHFDCPGDEHPRDMAILLTVLVLLSHACLMQWLLRSTEQTSPAKPLVMEVAMIMMSSPKPSVALPPQPAPPSKAEKKPLPKKTPAKPIVKKTLPLSRQTPDFAPTESLAESRPAPAAASSSSSTGAGQAESAGVAPRFTEADYRAHYAHNPKPDYPESARTRGWTGKVLLRVRVSEQGVSEAVAVEQSSGHDILDESAIQAVKQWRFIPAKRGETPVTSSVIVPIVFNLRH